MTQYRRATVARPGVIVSTIADKEQAQTVTFRRDLSAHIGFTTEVRYDEPRDAYTAHIDALATA